MILLVYLILSCIRSIDLQIYISHLPLSVELGTGTLVSPYTNLIMGIADIMIKIDSLPVPINIDILLLSDYYIIQENDFKHLPKNLTLNNLGSFYLLFGRKSTNLKIYPLPCLPYLNDISKCTYKVDWMVKTSIFGLLSSLSLSIYNVRVIGRDLKLSYNESCWNKREGCCYDDAFFYSSGHACSITNIDAASMNIGGIYLYFITVKSGSVTTLRNFEVIWFNALRSGAAFGNFIYGISSFLSKLNNVTIVLNNFNMERAFFFSGFMNLKLQNSLLYVTNSSFNQYYDMIYPNYYTPMLLYMLQLKASDLQFIIIFENSLISNVSFFLKTSSIDIRMKNVTFTNFRRNYECRSSSSLFFTGIIINSLPEKTGDLSNFTFNDVYIENADSACYLDNYNWLFSINNNLNVQNMIIKNFKTRKISIFKFTYNAYCRISNLKLVLLTCYLCKGIIIDLVPNANFILKNSLFSNISFSAKGLFSGSANSTIMISNTSFENISICEDQNIPDPKGIILSMMEFSYIMILNCSFLDIDKIDNGGLLYLDGKSILIIEQTVFNNIVSDSGSIVAANYETNFTLINCFFSQIGYKNEIYFYEKSNVLIYLSTFQNLNKAAPLTNDENSLFKCNKLCNLTLINNLLSDFNFFSAGKSIFSFQDAYLLIHSTFFIDLSMHSLIHSTGVLKADIITNKFFDLNLEGALFAQFSQANLTLVRCEFRNLNFIQTQGGIVYFHVKGCIFLNDSKFLDLTFENADGGLLYTYESKIVIHSIVIENITGIYSKSLIYLDSANSLEMYDSIIKNVSLDSDGGLLFSYYNNIITFQKSYIKGIVTTGSGGTFNLQSNNVLILNQMTISYSKSSAQGGVIFIEISNFIYINQTSIENAGGRKGGFIFMENGNSLNMVESIVKWCEAEQSGGFSVSGYDQIFILRSVMIGVVSTKTNGGVFGLIGNIGYNKIYIDESFFMNISANDSGGGFSVESNFNKMIFFSNLIENVYCYDGSGGLFLISQSNRIVLENSSFLNIYSLLQGGLISAEFLNSYLFTQINVYRICSLESYGGLCYMDSDNELLMENSNILYVTAKLSGGGFYMLTQNLIRINNTLFFNIKSDFSGGLLYVNRRNTILMLNSTVDRVDALKEGSLLLFLEETNASLIHSEFLNGMKNEGMNFISGGVQSFLQLNDSRIKLLFSSIFLSLLQSKCILKNNSFNPNFTVDLFFKFNAVMAYFELLHFKINILSNFVECKNSELKLHRFSLINKINSNIILKDSQIKIIQSTFVSISNNRSGFIISENSEIFIVSSSFSLFRSSNNGGIIICQNSEIVIKMSLFLLNQADISGGVIYDIEQNNLYNRKNISIRSSIFVQNKAKSNSAVLFYTCISSDCPSSFLMQRSNFILSHANIGSNLYLENIQNCLILDNKFISSIALSNKRFLNLSKGGAFYFKNMNPSPKIFWRKNKFERNKAQSGGAIYLDLPNFKKIEASYDFQQDNDEYEHTFESIYSDNFFEFNKASFFGDNAASNIQNLMFLGEDFSFARNKFMKDVVSGAQYNSCLLTLGGVDLFGNIAYLTDEDYLKRMKIELINEGNLTNSLDYSLENGLICFKGVFKRLQFPIKSEFNYRIWLEGGRQADYLQLSLSFRDCNLGEILTDSFQCQPCKEGTFSFQKEFLIVSEKCQLCLDSNPFYCLGGNDLRPRAGFWRLSNESTNFLKCRDIEACIDGMNFPLFNCATGYSGILCDECQQGYGHTSFGVCAKCEGVSVGDVFSILLRLFMVIFSIVNSYQMVCSICSSDLSHNEVIVTNMIKTLVNHIQIILVIQEFPSLLPPSLLPSSILTVFSILLSISPNMSEGLSTECLTRSFGIRMPYLKMIFCFVYPILILLVGIAFILLMHCIRGEKMKFHIRKLNLRKKDQKNLSFSFDRPSLLSPSFSPDKFMMEKNSGQSSKRSQPITLLESEENTIPFLWVIATTFISIIILVFPDLLKIFLQIFCCVNVADSFSPEMRLDVDLNIKCENSFSSESNASYIIWRNYLGIPGLILVGLFVPIFLVSRMGLAYKKDQLKERKVMFIYGFFYYAYKGEYFYWDLVIWLRKFLMMFINIFYMKVLEDKRDLSPILLIFVVLIISCILHFECQPFERKYNVVNTFESFSLIVLVITIFATTFLFSQTIFKEPTITIRLAILSIILVANLLFFLYFFVNIYVYNLKIRLIQLKRMNLIEKLKLAHSKFSKNSSIFISKIFNNKTEGRKSSPRKFSMKFSRFSQPNPIRLTIVERNRKILKKKIKSFLFAELQTKSEKLNLLHIENAFLEEQVENKDNLCLMEKNLKNNFLQNFAFDDIPQEKGEENKFAIRMRGDERSFFLACLKNRERVVLIDDKISRIDCQSSLYTGENGDCFVKVILEVRLKMVFQSVTFDVVDDEDYGIYFKEKMNLVGMEEESNFVYHKIFKIFARLDTIPIKIPKARIEIMNFISENIVEILLPLCLYKYMIFSHKKMDEQELDCLANLEWKTQTIKKLKKFRNLKEMHNFLPNSFYYKSNKKICENKDGFLILKGRLGFYLEFEIYVVIELEIESNHVTVKVFHGNSKQKILALLLLDEIAQIIQSR